MGCSTYLKLLVQFNVRSSVKFSFCYGRMKMTVREYKQREAYIRY